MALSLKKHIDAIRIDLNVNSDDHKLADLDEYLADKFHNMRSTLIREEFNSRRLIDQQYYQITNCHELTCVQNKCTIAGIEVTSPNKIYKVVLSSPLVTGVGDANIQYCGKDGLLEDFTRLTFFQLTSLNGRRWGRKRTKFLPIGNEIYFFDLEDESLRFITLVALFYDPTGVCGWDSEDPYPCPSDYKLQLLVKKDILETWNVPSDKINDTNFLQSNPGTAAPKSQAVQDTE